MFSNDNMISIRQLQILLILNNFGMSIVVLPRKVSQIAGQDGAWLILAGLLVSFIYLFIINKVAQVYPNESFVSYCCKILGKPLGYLISLGFILKIIFSLALEIRAFSEIINEIILFKTPISIISISMLILGGYAASKGYEARGRIAEILIFFILIPLIFVLLLAIFDSDINNLKPFFENINIKTSLQGGFFSAFYFSSIEFVLFVYPYIKDKSLIQKSTFKAVSFIGIIMFLISLITISRFGKEDVNHQMWPVLEIMDTINLPGSFIESQEALIMSFWIIAIFIIISTGFFFSSLLFKDIIKKGKHSIYILICLPIIYFLSLIPRNISEVYKFMDILNITFGVFYLFIAPFIMLVVAKIRRLGEKT